MQTKFLILAGVFGVITGLSFSTNQNILLSIGTALIAAIFGLSAFLSKDKKDKQIEEIHQMVTTPLKPETVEEPEPTKSVFEERAERGETILRSF
jgi:hypothetical protein